MRLSGEEASSLLKKWHVERTPVRAFIASGSGSSLQLAAKVTGFVRGFPNERSWSILVMDGPFDPNLPTQMPDNPGNLILIADRTAATDFEYIEAKDEDQPDDVRQRFIEVHGLACLSINLAGDLRLSIFEVEN